MSRRAAARHPNDIPAAAEDGFFGTYRAQAAKWETIKADFVSAVHFEMMRDPSMQRRYAYFKPSDVGVWGQLAAYVEHEETAAATV